MVLLAALTGRWVRELLDFKWSDIYFKKLGIAVIRREFLRALNSGTFTLWGSNFHLMGSNFHLMRKTTKKGQTPSLKGKLAIENLRKVRLSFAHPGTQLERGIGTGELRGSMSWPDHIRLKSHLCSAFEPTTSSRQSIGQYGPHSAGFPIPPPTRPHSNS